MADAAVTTMDLVRIAIALGAESVGGPLSQEERRLCDQARALSLPPGLDLHAVRRQIRDGDDPLGAIWQQGTARDVRYRLGIVLTPPHIVRAMMRWIRPANARRIVDMGCGSGRFTLEAARKYPDAALVAVDMDPVATVLTRAALATIGHKRAQVLNADYLSLRLDRIRGVTAFVGNPPYVRHHALSPQQKAAAVALARSLGHELSGLAGLHVHFLVATAALAAPGDVGCVITAAEWMQTRYGETLRALLAGPMGLEVLHLLDPAEMAFPGVMTTAAIIGFKVGTRRPHVSITTHATPATLGRSNGSRAVVSRSALAGQPWKHLIPGNGRMVRHQARDGLVSLGSVFRVHRGVATGANDFFVLTREEAAARGLLQWVRPVLSTAEEVAQAGGLVRCGPATKVLLCAPADVDVSAPENAALRAYLKLGEERGIHRRYLCAHRTPWWYLGPLKAAPIVVTYMGRRPPVFALNQERLGFLNVIHGLYPLKPLPENELRAWVGHLNRQAAIFESHGRVYQGRLRKFEPREIEGIPVKPIDQLLRG